MRFVLVVPLQSPSAVPLGGGGGGALEDPPPPPHAVKANAIVIGMKTFRRVGRCIAVAVLDKVTGDEGETLLAFCQFQNPFMSIE